MLNMKKTVYVVNLPPNITPRSKIGLGDMVEKVAQPIAKAIDAVAGTKIAECGGCKKRKEFLNNISK